MNFAADRDRVSESGSVPVTEAPLANFLDRRVNLVGRRATSDVPRVTVGGVRVAALGMDETADLMLHLVRLRRNFERPLILTSANGEVLSRCDSDHHFGSAMRQMDVVSADGEPLVLASRIRTSTPLPERVATTDLFHVVTRKAVAHGLTYYFFGATEEENRKAVLEVQSRYPGLKIVGRSHGYVGGAALERVVDEINRAAPDILWVSLGVPREQGFARQFASRLTRVGLIKTSGGLFNFLSGSRARAPGWMQSAGLEWFWRMMLEPRRLFWRYLRTNPHALYLLWTRSGSRPPAPSRRPQHPEPARMTTRHCARRSNLTLCKP